MNQFRWIAALSLAAVLLAAFASPAEARKKKTLHDIPLQWKPTDDIGDTFGGLDLTDVYDVGFRIEPFVDKRDDAALIGENREDADEGKILKVTTTDDVGAWVSENFTEVLSIIGLKINDGGEDVVLSGEIRRFFVNEESTYKSDVAVLITAQDGSGKTLWKGLAGGDATRFGRSYKAENYYEVLSDAVMEAMSSLLDNSGFRQAVAGK